MVRRAAKEYMVTKFLGFVFAFMMLFSLSVWAEDIKTSSEDNPSMFIKEGGLPKAASDEIETILARTPKAAPIQNNLVQAAAVTLEDYLLSQLKLEAENISVSSYGLLIDDVYATFSAVLNKHPELYYVKTSLRYAYNGSTGVVTTLYMEYYDYDRQAIMAEMEKVLALIDENMTDLEKALFIHDYLCIDVEYAYEDYLQGKVSSDAHSLKGAILDKIAVCDGYASAFQYYMTLLDIPCNIVTNANHAWNQVYIDGNWYFVDATWDDSVWDDYGNVSHLYFMKSEDAMENHDWSTASGYEAGNNTDYDDAFWNSTSTQILYQNGTWYYVDSDGNLYQYDFAKNSITETGTLITNMDGKWYVYGSNTSYYRGCYTKIAKKDGMLYYTQPTGIYKCEFDGSNKNQIIEADISNGYVYGMKIKNGKLYYQIAKSPSTEEKSTNTYDLEIDISGYTMILSGTVYTYTGTEKNPTVTINGLVNGTDYTVQYKNNINAGTATVTVTGTGDYKGNLSKTYKINKAAQSISISKTSITKTYGDAAFSLGAKASGGGKLTYTSQNTKAATVSSDGKVTIKGAGTTTIYIAAAETANYNSASKPVNFTVNAKKISGTVKVAMSKYVYNGKEKKPTVTLANLVKDKDYKVTYSNNINIGKGKVTVIGIGNYKGTLTQTFQIVPAKTIATTIKSAEKGKIQLKWTKQVCAGYEIVYSKNSNFSGTNKRVKITGSTNISKTTTGFQSGKKYYVKIRAYKTVNGIVYYGDYSSKFSVMVK